MKRLLVTPKLFVAVAMRFVAVAMVCWLFPAVPAHADPAEAFTLNGPWRFHVGDDARWAEPAFDDSGWETVDLTPRPGDHDPDVGLTGYVPGWQARGHAGYFGYAWYRIRVAIDAQGTSRKPLVMCGPFYVDNVYQVYVDGRLLGGAGDFSSRPPTAYNNHLPRLYVLPSGSVGADHSKLIAIRVWMGSWFARNLETGGIHIAPVLGTRAGVEPTYQLEWRQVIQGYVVDAVEAVLFLLLAGLVGVLLWNDRADRSAYAWMAIALILLALRRGNQPVFFWWQFESLAGFELVTLVLLIPACVAVWTIAWRSWFGMRGGQIALGSLMLLYMASECTRRSWFYGVLPPWVSTAARTCSMLVRLSFLITTVWTVARGVRRNPKEGWFVVPAVVSLSVGLFADELSLLGAPGIWFPFGVGVSRTQYAYAAFDIAFAGLLLRRMADERALSVSRPRKC
jgi:hypothetical protein